MNGDPTEFRAVINPVAMNGDPTEFRAVLNQVAINGDPTGFIGFFRVVIYDDPTNRTELTARWHRSLYPNVPATLYVWPNRRRS
jgi:hypothetical protein